MGKMKTVYQVQFRRNASNDTEWHTYNAHKTYDVVDTIEEARQVLNNAKEWHERLKAVSTEEYDYQYRIATMQYTVEYTEA